MKGYRSICLGLWLMFAATAFGQEKRMAVVETSTCYMRLQPDYESVLETQELMGTVVEIVAENGYWREIISPQPYTAWTTEKTLVEMTPEQIKEYEKAVKYMFTDLYGHMHKRPSKRSDKICDLVGGDVLRAVVKTDPVKKFGWAQVMLPSGRTGWVKKNSLKLLEDRINIREWNYAQGVVSEDRMEDIIEAAHELLGVPYLWGGMSSKGVDCSGLVRISAIMNDVMLPRNASQQVNCGKEIEVPRKDTEGVTDDEDVKKGYTTKIAKSAIKNLKRGDLVFFGNTLTKKITHVGIYLGDGEIIHASHMVRINSLIPGEDNYYENAHRLIRACRLSH